MLISVSDGTRSTVPGPDATGPAGRELHPADRDWLADAAFSWITSYRWSARGLPPTPDRIERLMWEGVIAQTVVVAAGSGAPLGVLQLYGPDLSSGFVNLAFALRPGRGAEVAGPAAAFVASAFRDFPLRKIYVEVLAGAATGVVPEVLAGAVLEATLAGHDRLAEDSYADLNIFGIDRA